MPMKRKLKHASIQTIPTLATVYDSLLEWMICITKYIRDHTVGVYSPSYHICMIGEIMTLRCVIVFLLPMGYLVNARWIPKTYVN